MNIFLQKENKIAIHKQIYDYFRTEILTGNIKEGTKLPSIRQLASDLQISKNTVNEAFQQLMAEGYIESKQKKGYWAVKIEGYVQEEQKAALIQRGENREEEKCSIDFQYGDIDLRHFPTKVWKKHLADSVDALEKEVMMYGEKQGYRPLRKEIARYLYQSRGIHCHPDQIVIAAGTQNIIRLLVSLFQERPHIAMENPGYDGVKNIFKKEGCKLTPISVNRMEGYCMENLENSSCNLAYVTPSHQFPLGMIMPITKRLSLLKWAKKQNAFIIEDDYDSEFRYEGAPIPSLKGLDRVDRVIYIGTFSKSFLPAARVSYMVLPANLLEIYHASQKESQQVSPIIQSALARFLENGDFFRHLRKMRKVYEEKRRIVVESIYKYMGKQVKIIGEKAGLHLLLFIEGKNPDALREQAKANKIKVYTGVHYYWADNQEEKERPIVLGFGGLEKGELESGISLLAQTWFGNKNE
ncbi:MocR-like pyridoxine biosynthesis transcription factor PdxR [Niallia nealsonii]|uniref:PLP-dependent aminotransferase family protein n=1 Tax=Niallia nealsonii TaxID=115979 RepID=A0A2N0YYQ7_9BACI|nr:PLP-dependent aminotransferase family protein [Niallia nealsonii]PKG22391.1 PLP-dependent aminotransferase family protein [Niallia nealsonii]